MLRGIRMPLMGFAALVLASCSDLNRFGGYQGTSPELLAQEYEECAEPAGALFQAGFERSTKRVAGSRVVFFGIEGETWWYFNNPRDPKIFVGDQCGLTKVTRHAYPPGKIHTPGYTGEPEVYARCVVTGPPSYCPAGIRSSEFRRLF